MSETMQPTISVALEKGDDLLEQKVTASADLVKVGEFKAEVLSLFGEGSPLLEAEPETDEDESWVMLGFDAEGKGTQLTDAEEIRLSDYASYRATPATTVGTET